MSSNNKNTKRGGGRFSDRQKSDFDQKVLDIRRVARVTKGGKRFNFRVTLVAGNKKGEVGVGMGKSSDTAGAMDKAFRNAKKNIIKPVLTKELSIPHESEAKFGSSEIIIRPAKGRGLIAGSSAKIVLEMAGIKDVNAKFLSRSKNKVNNARVTVEALKKLVARS